MDAQEVVQGETAQNPQQNSGQQKEETANQQPQVNPVAVLLEWSDRKGTYAFSVLLAIIGVMGSMVPYVVAGTMVVGIFNGVRDWSFYLQWGLIAAVGYIVQIIFHHFSTTVSHIATFATIANLRVRLAQKLTRVPMGYVLDTPSGTLKRLLVEKIDSIETTLAHAVPELTSNLTVVLAVFIYLAILDWRLALATLLTIVVGLGCLAGMMKDYAFWYQNTITTGKEMNNASVEYVSGIEVIKAFGQSASSYEKFSKAVYASAHAFIDWMSHCQIWQDAMLSVAPATLVTVLPLGCLFVMQGTLSPSTFVMCAVLSLGVFQPLYAAMSFGDSLAQVGTIVEEISEVLNYPDQKRAEKPCALEGTDIVLTDVHFAYDADEVIHGIDLTVASGQVTAFVGPSGSGKSTLARLVAGFWDPTEGSVSIGGKDIRMLAASQLADLVAYVDQDSYLFDETIMDNIRMGRKGATDDEVIACAKASGCHNFIQSLPDGYQTVVGGSGGHLSGGERQRVAIARAMLKNAPIILLDEATAYADPESEAEVESAVAKLVAGKTLVVIAHRLSTVQNADKIVVVNDGRIEAQGTHDQLMDTCPLYATMYRAHMGALDEA
ncbi:ABC transporter ATP-binding protein [Lancefieldella sp. Marseille-Q7238]|uniref:ABC transporter ATP-binding protein n=1 Tax=Lancefieldella sp. Marseille-Q7238 TaxID=3022127 RepID=UPI0024A94F1E|nr:ABC transporter ATP-binding protein [Lancefieldella sp. Marseille-Q7238]